LRADHRQQLGARRVVAGGPVGRPHGGLLCNITREVDVPSRASCTMAAATQSYSQRRP
jgi:hypothetical protein